MGSELWQRLRALRRRTGLSGEAFGAELGVSKAAVSQWESRDATKRTTPDLTKVLEMARIYGAPIQWLLNDEADADEAWWDPQRAEEPRPDFTGNPQSGRGAAPRPQSGGTHLGGHASHHLPSPANQWARRVLPTVRAWESLMQGPLEAEFQTTMPDTSMAPEVRKGATIVCITGVEPVPGDFVLVADQHGTHYLREYRQTRPGTWEAHALNTAYLPLLSERDGLKVLAVFDGLRGRRSER